MRHHDLHFEKPKNVYSVPVEEDLALSKCCCPLDVLELAVLLKSMEVEEVKPQEGQTYWGDADEQEEFGGSG